MASNGAAGNQTTGNAFGAGAAGGNGHAQSHNGGGGGGGGFYGGKGGGASNGTTGGGGGSGYIGNTSLISKYMYCYNCPTSSSYDQRTYSTGNVSGSPISNYAKSGSGAARITFITTEKVDFTMEVGESLLYDTADSKTFIVPVSGTYKLEAWGAQGGSGGYGGYSTGTVTLTANTKLYLSIGGAGSGQSGGYNGGGSGGGPGHWTSQQYDYTINHYGAVGQGGGGATHIATAAGLLSGLSSNRGSILIVAGGGGGAGGSGGGYSGVASNGAAGNQTTGNAFGSGGAGGNGNNWYAPNGGHGGGGGYYGGVGGTASGNGGGGGSGYIGNSLLTNKAMYCYNCPTSSDENTLTYSTTNVSGTPTSNYAKSGNGAIKITLLSKS